MGNGHSGGSKLHHDPGNPDDLCIDTIRTLSMDAVEQAKSGHPGTPMAMAPVVYTVWQRFLRFDPDDPIWPNRDRFVLSAGHASMLLYAILHLTGVKAGNADDERPGTAAVTLDDIRHFRQLGSKCPGHPEYHLTSGVEATTGPLGQGCGNSVGMAIAARWLAARFNRPEFPVFDYDVYTLCGDGDMMEGVASEAASLAGHLKLANLCWIYDSNRISIEGPTDITFNEDVAARFAGYGWSVSRVDDANDTAALVHALERFRSTPDRPTLILVHSHIGYGAPHKQDTNAAHGEPLGEDEVRLAKRRYGWPEDAHFLVPDSVYEHFQQGVARRGRRRRDGWLALFERYRAAHPDLADAVERMQRRQPPPGWDTALPSFPADPKGLATRDSSGTVLNAIAAHHPTLIGGAADLAPSTKTRLTVAGAGDLEPAEPGGRNLHFGVREHAMGAVVNGLALSKIRAFGSSFLIFSDYMKPPLRLSALMELPCIWIFTHDSIGLGEDGPTHQPVEQLVGLRAIPGLIVLRPADANEVVEAWRVIINLRHGPACLALTRQAVPTLDRTRYASAAGLARGAYVLANPADGREPEVILIGTGSEVSLCIAAFERLAAEGVAARVVSMPSWELFERQDEAYREGVLPPEVTARVSVEQGSVIGWDRYVGMTGAKIGMHGFGASAPLKDLLTRFGFTPDAVVAAARDQIAKATLRRR
ncbi:transketolase [Azospirillum sp. TSO22-1]|uniref:transketolase n=1 Tax=Azospirillum sp. TSO22-1 TaxID=716789 RepID=UPI000D61CC3F|nr:transketolase [Azospirillum sp. TSO22-1]PWC45766.1 transketolase [Azospirillum sp. TSO22-1]